MRPRSRAILDSLGRNVGKLALATTIAIVLAAMTHIAAILMLPWLARQDAYARLAPTASAENAVLVAAPRAGGFGEVDAPLPETWLPLHDPALAVGACAYDLADGPLRVSAPDGALFQTISLHARGAGAYYAITDRAAVRGRLELVVATRDQLDAILAEEAAAQVETGPADAFGDLRVVAPTREGFVLVRTLAAFPSEAPLAEALVEAVSCTIEPL
ncbi:DUF1254 domain-containing protein [Salinarimonas ramus]|uniref:DUF1254 domain-containing protein n=1 Tax=Salinarimonas ramus TaxID=690164 RepID=A0A917Q3J0_9HYPH|nr:hypothetical protein [Salinarimonas ramus]GGK17419.1 DUF1254 domain-containing protein [Salinarimonas ramus]